MSLTSFLKLFFLLALSIACSSSGNEEGDSASNSFLEEDDEFLELEKGTSSSFTSFTNLVITDQFSWESHYSLHRGNEFDAFNTPYVDFINEDLIALHLGARPSPAYSINIVSVTYDSTDNTIQIRYEELIDTITVWPQVISYPYIFIRTHRSDLEYRFISLGTRNIE